nr:hypothetical protein [Desulfobacterales bacterium]
MEKIDLEAKEVAFFSKITAGITHEIKNVLVIVKESSGSMEDFLSLCQAGSFPYLDKISSPLCTIRGQVLRGVELGGLLNQFAHSPDKTVASRNLNELVEQLYFFPSTLQNLRV